MSKTVLATGIKGGLIGLVAGAGLGIVLGVRKSKKATTEDPRNMQFGVETKYVHQYSDEMRALEHIKGSSGRDAQAFMSLVQKVDQLIGLYHLAATKKGDVHTGAKASRYCFQIDQLLTYLASRSSGMPSDFSSDADVLKKLCENHKFNINQEMAGQLPRLNAPGE